MTVKKLSRQWYRDHGLMQIHKDEFRSNVTFQEVAEVAYRDALEDAAAKAACCPGECKSETCPYCRTARDIRALILESTHD